MIGTHWHRAARLALCGCLVLPALAGEPGGRRGTRLFFRAVGARSNAPVRPKSRSAWTQDRQARTGSTGMSDHGFTEYPFCTGVMDVTFIEGGAYYPRLVSGAKAHAGRVNTADVVMDYVYEPDGCVWGLSGRELVQTFTATRHELVSVTLLVASPDGIFRAALVEGGPGGRQVAPSRTFASGRSMVWGTARWQAGEAPLVPGRTYGIRIRREDGKPWSPYLHATGNAYDGGLLHVDGKPHPNAELAAWIVEEPPDLTRAVVEGADERGWVYRTKHVTFVPRAKNVRLISLAAAPVTAQELRTGHVDLVARVWDGQGKRVGGPKRCLAVGPPGGVHAAHFLFAADELLVTPGQPYRIDVYTVPHKRADLPEDETVTVAARDLRARIYGEPEPGALPAIVNLEASTPTDSELRLRWSAPLPCPTRVETWGLGANDGKQTDLPPNATDVVLPKFWPSHRYRFRLAATGPTGLVWRTPLYEVRMPRGDEFPPLRQPQYPAEFLTLAPAKRSAAPTYGPIRYRKQIEVANWDFEDGLTGWKTGGKDKIVTTGSLQGIGVKWGRAMAGWSVLGGKDRQQVFAESHLSQRIATEPGHVYVLSAWAHTSVLNGPRGDTRVRLVADPAGGGDFEGTNATQWYWTDGRWMRFQHRWTAAAGRATIGLGLFRWSDQDRSSVYVDHVTVFDLGPAPAEPGDGVPRTAGMARLALVDPKAEAEERVEASLTAPPGYVVTGLGARAHYDNVTTLWLRVQPLLADGTLGAPEQLRGGWEPDAGLEAAIELPPGYIVTGFGARAAPEWDVKSLVVWGRPLAKDGTLGEEKEFRGGIEPAKGPERNVRLAPGRAITAAGLNCGHNDIDRIRAASHRLVRCAGARPE